jgi:chromosome segregation ATPase
MTFEKMVISPSPGLNLIIGPNGTGKSSIVCAIGLGASRQVLARTSKIANYVRHSCEFAKISMSSRPTRHSG